MLLNYGSLNNNHTSYFKQLHCISPGGMLNGTRKGWLALKLGEQGKEDYGNLGSE